MSDGELVGAPSVVFIDPRPWRRFARYLGRRMERDRARRWPRYQGSDYDLAARVTAIYDALASGGTANTDEIDSTLDELAGWLYGTPLHPVVLAEIAYMRRADAALTDARREAYLSSLGPEARAEWDRLVAQYGPGA